MTKTTNPRPATAAASRSYSAAIVRWLESPVPCVFCGDKSTYCAEAAVLSVGRPFPVPCGA